MSEKSKNQLMWEVSKEQEEEFRKVLKKKFQDSNDFDGVDIEELFKLIRGTEYRRGKEDANKDSIKKSVVKEAIIKVRRELINQQKSFFGKENPNYLVWSINMCLNPLIKELGLDSEVKE